MISIFKSNAQGGNTLIDLSRELHMLPGSIRLHELNLMPGEGCEIPSSASGSYDVLPLADMSILHLDQVLEGFPSGRISRLLCPQGIVAHNDSAEHRQVHCLLVEVPSNGHSLKQLGADRQSERIHLLDSKRRPQAGRVDYVLVNDARHVVTRQAIPGSVGAHSHSHDDEILRVSSPGTLRVWNGSAWVDNQLEEGSWVFIPAGVIHDYGVGENPIQLISIKANSAKFPDRNYASLPLNRTHMHAGLGES